VAEDGTITVAWKDSKGTVLLSQTSQAADGIWSLSFNAGDIPKGEVALSMSFADAHQNSATDVVSLSVLALNAKLQGSSGADTFGFKDAAVSGSAYAIEKFNLSEGDRLHISDLLTGFSVGVSDLSKWVSLATDAPNNKAVLTIDIDGAGAGIAQHEIYLQSTDLGALTLAALISDAVIY
jgi:Ca2+-binding RTX toxin-like protein